jgi:puromycin-sensitive aminopeptidase
VKWLDANAASTGFYRVSYSREALERLGRHLSALQPAERIGLLADQWALVRSGRASVGDFLDLILRFEAETDDAVLDELVGKLGYVEARLVDGEEQERFRRLVERLFGPRLRAMGWDPVAGESDHDRLRRGALLRAVAGVARSAPVLAEAAPRVDRVLNGQRTALDPNLVDTAVGVTARQGNAELFDRLRELFPREADPAVKRRYLLSLTAFEDPALVARAQALLFEGGVPLQDCSSYVHGLLANRAGRETAWGLLRERWADVLGATGGAPMLLRRVVEAREPPRVAPPRRGTFSPPIQSRRPRPGGDGCRRPSGRRAPAPRSTPSPGPGPPPARRPRPWPSTLAGGSSIPE